MIRKTFSRVAGDTYIFPLITLLTVAVDTSAAFAMSFMVIVIKQFRLSQKDKAIY